MFQCRLQDRKLHLFKVAIKVLKVGFNLGFGAHSHQLIDISYRGTTIDSYGEAPFELAIVVQLIDADAQFIHQKLDYGLDWKPVFNRTVKWGPVLKVWQTTFGFDNLSCGFNKLGEISTKLLCWSIKHIVQLFSFLNFVIHFL